MRYLAINQFGSLSLAIAGIVHTPKSKWCKIVSEILNSSELRVYKKGSWLNLEETTTYILGKVSHLMPHNREREAISLSTFLKAEKGNPASLFEFRSLKHHGEWMRLKKR